METITVRLSDAEMARLKALAEKLGVTPEDLLKTTLEEKLSFEEAADKVLSKNAELYRRLA